MTPRRLSLVGPLLTVVSLAGCISSPPAPTPPVAERVCVKVREVNAFSPLDDSHVLVKASTSDYYLFTVEKECTGLSFARGIAIADPSSRVCSDGFDFLAFDHPGAGMKRCRIVAIEPVADERTARALIESRAASEQPRGRKDGDHDE